MSKFEKSKVIPRYMAIAVLLTLACVAIVGRALYLMTVKKDYWTEVAGRQKRDSIPMTPARGNILSCDGQLMATSIPEYRIYIDFQPGKQAVPFPFDKLRGYAETFGDLLAYFGVISDQNIILIVISPGSPGPFHGDRDRAFFTDLGEQVIRSGCIQDPGG